MEFRCRLGTTSGDIIEGVYVAQSEAALRRELEDKGLHVLSLRPRLGFGGISSSATFALPQATPVPLTRQPTAGGVVDASADDDPSIGPDDAAVTQRPRERHTESFPT